MTKFAFLKSTTAAIVPAIVVSTVASAAIFNIPAGDLRTALNAYTTTTGVDLIYPDDEVAKLHTNGVQGDLSADDALSRLLRGTGFVVRREAGGIAIVRNTLKSSDNTPPVNVAATAASGGANGPLETVTVTSSKIGGDVQNIPISITALSQEQLTATQTAGGPDLVKQVPNLTFSKTNFTGYNIQIRGIGTQAISVTTDPAVAVAFNDIPFLRNHFFEQEFFDVSQVEVLRGPQGTLYGRNATAGVVNLVSAKPTDQYEAMASVDIGNYSNRRLEGMLNVPVMGDKLDLRVAGEWTKRDGYSFDEETGHSVDGRDLWSGRMSLLAHPFERLTANFVWEHFNENDDRERSTKQLCEKDVAPAAVDGPTGPQAMAANNYGAVWLEQGCKPTSLYAPTAYQTPNASAVPFIAALYAFSPYLAYQADPYSGLTQSPDLRVTSSLIDPHYIAKNDTYELNIDFTVMPTLTFASQTAYNQDHLYSTEDYNLFGTTPGLYTDTGAKTLVGQDGEYCDPQLGCSSRLVAQDVSREHAHQFYQELRLTSNMDGPFNFVAGANYLNYRTLEDYFVLSNAITLGTEYFNRLLGHGAPPPLDAPHIPFDPVNADSCGPLPAGSAAFANGYLGLGYVDPNPLADINGQGHNYFRSENPYELNSWAAFGETYYQVAPDVKLTGGLRFTDDRKSFEEIPSWTQVVGEGYPVVGTLDQEWKEVTGRANITWTPKLDFTDQTLVYASYSRGYKGGGANPPGVIPILASNLGNFYINSPSNQTHPLTFKPEFNNAFEIGTKNSLLDGEVTLNGDAFFYKYQNYQISQIVDRTSVNLNFNATVRGAELETTWEPLPGLRFNFSGGYENATLDSGSQAIDLMDRTAGHSDWMVVKPYILETSNCVLPKDVVNEFLAGNSPVGQIFIACFAAYVPGYVQPRRAVMSIRSRDCPIWLSPRAFPATKGSIRQLRPIWARASTRTSAATNCLIRRRSRCHLVHNTRCRSARVGRRRDVRMGIGRAILSPACSTTGRMTSFTAIPISTFR